MWNITTNSSRNLDLIAFSQMLATWSTTNTVLVIPSSFHVAGAIYSIVLYLRVGTISQISVTKNVTITVDDVIVSTNVGSFLVSK